MHEARHLGLLVVDSVVISKEAVDKILLPLLFPLFLDPLRPDLRLVLVTAF